MENTKDIIEVVDYLVSNRIKFVIFKKPISEDIILYLEMGNLGFDVFVIQDFDSSKKALSISGDLILKRGIKRFMMKEDNLY